MAFCSLIYFTKCAKSKPQNEPLNLDKSCINNNTRCDRVSSIGFNKNFTNNYVIFKVVNYSLDIFIFSQVNFKFNKKIHFRQVLKQFDI